MVSFASCADAMKMHPTAASILDDIRFLIATIVALPDDPSPQEIQKLQSTSQWIHNRIAALPVDSPDSPRPTPSPPPQRASASPTPSQASSNSQTLIDDNSPSSADKVTVEPVSAGKTPDFLYQSIRLAALIYTSAIVSRKPFSESCAASDLYRLWTTMWRVPLATWKSMVGIFLWIEIAITPPSRDTPHGRFVKSMLTIAGLSMGIDNWSASSNALRGAMRLQAWLNGGRKGDEEELAGIQGGRSVIEKKGSQMVKWKGT